MRVLLSARVLVCASALTGAFAMFTNAVVAADDAPPNTIVDTVPTENTPNVMDGAVRTIAEIGDTVYIGGTFTSVAPPGSTNGASHPYLVAFDAGTGQIIDGFDPGLDGPVNALAAGPDGTLYVGGGFNNVGGTREKAVTRLNATSGQRIGSFDAAPLNGLVWDMELSGDHLIIGGVFTKVDGIDQAAVASLDANTGARDPYIDADVTGVHNGGATKVRTMTMRPDETGLMIGGNFSEVDAASREQVALLDLGDDATSLSSWATKRFSAPCSRAFSTYLRDMNYAPDSSYLAIVTTGAGFSGTLCDAASRWEADATGGDQRESWASYSGGDTLTSVEITDSVVYVGGHQRWMNNPLARDAAGPGAVPRSGIAAVDPRNGVPFTWSPGRPRGYGVWDMLITDSGLYVGSDTDAINGRERYKIAQLPHGPELPAERVGALPNNVTVLRPDGAVNVDFDGTSAGTPAEVPGSPAWPDATASTMINDTLYVAHADGTLTAQTFDGATFGDPTEVDLHGITSFATDLASMTGMFYDPQLGRLYYTRAGSTSLYYRYFLPESQLTEPRRFTAENGGTGFDPGGVDGMFLDGDKLYYSSAATGDLSVIDWADGTTAGSGTEANSSVDWSGPAFIDSASSPQPNQDPVADFGFTCTALTCEFDASAADDPDGSIAEYTWDFGDGATTEGVTATHTFAAADTYRVSLTVADDAGATDSVAKDVTVSETAPDEIGFRASSSVNSNVYQQRVGIPLEAEADDGLLLFVSQNGSEPLSAPDGWTLVDSEDTGGVTSTLYQKQATAGDIGSVVEVTSPVRQKINMELLAYSGTADVPVADFKVVTEDRQLTEHTSPTADVTSDGSWVVTHFTDKSSSTTAWTDPDSATTRSISLGTGGGRITSLTADSAGVISTGTYGAITATTDQPSASSAAWTVVLAPAT